MLIVFCLGKTKENLLTREEGNKEKVKIKG